MDVVASISLDVGVNDCHLQVIKKQLVDVDHDNKQIGHM